MPRCTRILPALGLALSIASFAGAAGAADAPALTGFRGDVVANMQEAGDKIIELSAAMPVGRWSWRPGKGVRSVGEVYMHLVAYNYILCGFLGATAPMTAEQIGKLEAAPANPQKTAQMLRESYAFATTTIAGTPDSALDEQVPFFGNRRVSRRTVMLALASHSHEHLGQSIAYARMCGIVPPWTAREQAAKKTAKK